MARELAAYLRRQGLSRTRILYIDPDPKVPADDEWSVVCYIQDETGDPEVLRRLQTMPKPIFEPRFESAVADVKLCELVD